MDTTTYPVNPQQKQLIDQLTGNLSQQQIAWLSGYLFGQVEANRQLLDLLALKGSPVHQNGNTNGNFLPNNGALLQQNGSTQQTQPQLQSAVVPQTLELTVLFGSHSGNSRKVADKVKVYAESNGIKTKVADMSSYNAKDLKKEKNLLVIVSTHGEGEPPLSAEDLHGFIHSNKAPKLDGLLFSVLSLGDKSYVHFCKTGIDFDTQLEKLGATRLYKRVDCDVAFDADAQAWTEAAVNAFKNHYGATQQASVQVVSVQGTTTVLPKAVSVEYTRENPYAAALNEKLKLTGRGSSKEIYHIELSLEGSGIVYEVGDSAGVYPENSKRLVQEVLKASKLNPSDIVDVNGQMIALETALTRNFELSILTRELLHNHNKRAASKELDGILGDTRSLQEYTYGRDVADLLAQFDVRYSPQQLVDVLRPLPPRLYSISSSINAVPDELHLTVGIVRYKKEGRYKEGVCSTYLSDRTIENSHVKIFIQKNEGFRLPADSQRPVIMIGPGTGVAPFRAFIQEREAQDAKGKNWLFFGERNFATDFLYHLEWLNYLKKGVLTNLDVAFSRDTDKKVYVQHKILQRSKEVYAWLQEGAHVYVCGDKSTMAPDVRKAFTQVLQQEGGLTEDQANERLKQLRKEQRYQEDVY